MIDGFIQQLEGGSDFVNAEVTKALLSGCRYD